MSIVSYLDELHVIRIPTSAATLDGFCAWVTSDEFSHPARMSFVDGTILIDLGLDLPMIYVPVSALSLEGFRAWATSDSFPERGRFSFIRDEVLIDMSPEELNTHNRIKTAISTRLHGLAEDLDLGIFYGDRTLLANPAAGLSTEPDAVFVTWDSFDSGRVRLTPRPDRPGESTEMEGAPDWVLEVVSRTSVRKDTKVLREMYHRAGIPEYWLVNALGDEIDFRVLVHHPDGYEVTAPQDGWYLSPVFRRHFRLERTRHRGYWKYVLHVRE